VSTTIPDKTGINASDKCAGATNVPDADWWGKLHVTEAGRHKITVTDQNRFLTFMAYRSIQPKNFRVAFNNNDDGNPLFVGQAVLITTQPGRKVTVST
jgi:hypothetical protein